MTTATETMSIVFRDLESEKMIDIPPVQLAANLIEAFLLKMRNHGTARGVWNLDLNQSSNYLPDSSSLL